MQDCCTACPYSAIAKECKCCSTCMLLGIGCDGHRDDAPCSAWIPNKAKDV